MDLSLPSWCLGLLCAGRDRDINLLFTQNLDVVSPRWDFRVFNLLSRHTVIKATLTNQFFLSQSITSKSSSWRFSERKNCFFQMWWVIKSQGLLVIAFYKSCVCPLRLYWFSNLNVSRAQIASGTGQWVRKSTYDPRVQFLQFYQLLQRLRQAENMAEIVLLCGKLQEKDKPHRSTALAFETQEAGALLQATCSQSLACSLGLCTYENGEHYCHVNFPSLSSGPWSSSVSPSGLMRPLCMERSCHPIILRCIPITQTKLGESRSLWDMVFTFISHIWISSHHRTANMTLWRYCLFLEWEKDKKAG